MKLGRSVNKNMKMDAYSTNKPSLSYAYYRAWKKN